MRHQAPGPHCSPPHPSRSKVSIRTLVSWGLGGRAKSPPALQRQGGWRWQLPRWHAHRISPPGEPSGTTGHTSTYFSSSRRHCGKPTRALSAPQSHQAPVRKAFLPTDKKKESPIQKQPSQQRKIEKVPRQQHRDGLTPKRKMSFSPGAVYSELSNVTR